MRHIQLFILLLIFCTACRHYSISNEDIKQIRFDVFKDNSGWRPGNFRTIINRDSIQELIRVLNKNQKINPDWLKWRPQCRLIFVYRSREDTIYSTLEDFRNTKNGLYHFTYHLSDTTSIYSEILKEELKKNPH
jgi:hypothetical protein